MRANRTSHKAADGDCARRFPSALNLCGTSFKPEYLPDIAAEMPRNFFFEIHAENYMVAGGPRLVALERIRRDHPLSVHGVCMSLGGREPPDRAHLARFRALIDRFEPDFVSEHLAWSRLGSRYFNDLLPIPYTEETLARVCEHVSAMQDALGRTVLIENPATYLSFVESALIEPDFICRLVDRTGCGLLLDLNNLFVSSVNHGFSAEAYLKALPLGRVGEIHLAGHKAQKDDAGATLLIDSHDCAVAGDVWALYGRTIRLCGPLPTLIEWDSALPAWPVLRGQAEAARIIQRRNTAVEERSDAA